MQYDNIKCVQCVGGGICNGRLIRYGRNRSGNQRYLCKDCGKTQMGTYRYRACISNMNNQIKSFLKEGCGIRSISRLLHIAPGTVLRRILRMSKAVKPPVISYGKEYELDELRTYIKHKTRLYWVVYAIRKDTKEVVAFSVGCRTNKTLKLVTDTLILSDASKVYTDKLRNYSWLLPQRLHCTQRRGTNHIERKNLTLRTHLKRLSRRTICYSKSAGMLTACLRIYFWG